MERRWKMSHIRAALWVWFFGLLFSLTLFVSSAESGGYDVNKMFVPMENVNTGRYSFINLVDYMEISKFVAAFKKDGDLPNSDGFQVTGEFNLGGVAWRVLRFKKRPRSVSDYLGAIDEFLLKKEVVFVSPVFRLRRPPFYERGQWFLNGVGTVRFKGHFRESEINEALRSFDFSEEVSGWSFNADREELTFTAFGTENTIFDILRYFDPVSDFRLRSARPKFMYLDNPISVKFWGMDSRYSGVGIGEELRLRLVFQLKTGVLKQKMLKIGADNLKNWVPLVPGEGELKNVNFQIKNAALTKLSKNKEGTTWEALLDVVLYRSGNFILSPPAIHYEVLGNPLSADESLKAMVFSSKERLVLRVASFLPVTAVDTERYPGLRIPSKIQRGPVWPFWVFAISFGVFSLVAAIICLTERSKRTVSALDPEKTSISAVRIWREQIFGYSVLNCREAYNILKAALANYFLLDNVFGIDSGQLRQRLPDEAREIFNQTVNEVMVKLEEKIVVDNRQQLEKDDLDKIEKSLMEMERIFSGDEEGVKV